MPTEHQLLSQIQTHEALAQAVAAAEFWHGKTVIVGWLPADRKPLRESGYHDAHPFSRSGLESTGRKFLRR